MSVGHETPSASPHLSQFSDFLRLKQVSAKLGADPDQVQAGGGNTSLKIGDRLIIKASGKPLRNALEEDIFVTVSAAEICAQLETPEVSRDELKVAATNLDGRPASLRPSIETAFHAVLPAAAVLHTHSTSVLAYAILRNGSELLETKLAGLPWTWIPYAKPGPRVAQLIQKRIRNGNFEVFILANHGVIVTGDTVAAAMSLLDEVERRLLPLAFRPPRAANVDVLWRVAEKLRNRYRPAEDASWHDLGMDPRLFEIVVRGSLYPDHVVFLGPAISFIREEDDPFAPLNCSTLASGREPPILLLKGAGCLVNVNLESSPIALMGCLARVARKFQAGQVINYLSTTDEAELLNWEAEEYRQRMAGVK